jgi:hypothetical protein
MSYRRRKTGNASLANSLPKSKGLAAISSIWFVSCLGTPVHKI